jgi:hypothetical protein
VHDPDLREPGAVQAGVQASLAGVQGRVAARVAGPVGVKASLHAKPAYYDGLLFDDTLDDGEELAGIEPGFRLWDVGAGYHFDRLGAPFREDLRASVYLGYGRGRTEDETGDSFNGGVLGGQADIGRLYLQGAANLSGDEANLGSLPLSASVGTSVRLSWVRFSGIDIVQDSVATERFGPAPERLDRGYVDWFVTPRVNVGPVSIVTPFGFTLPFVNGDEAREQVEHVFLTASLGLSLRLDRLFRRRE